MMNLYKIALFFTWSVVLISCGGKSDPKDAAIKFLNARNRMDYETAKKYATPATDSTLDQLKQLTETVEKGVTDLTSKTEIEVQGEPQIVGDTATLNVINTVGGRKIPETVLLVKDKEGNWLVHDNPYEYTTNIVTAVDDEDSASNDQSTVELEGKDSLQH